MKIVEATKTPTPVTPLPAVSPVVRRNDMDRYRVLHQVGDGTFGSVHLAISEESGDKVAIKR